MRSALLVVDLQTDFLPGGALAVPAGDDVLRPIAALMARGGFDCIVATQDWHPPGHVSFASSHAGHAPFDAIELYGHPQVLWPDHCIAGTDGAALADGMPWQLARAIVRKGTDRDVDSYSGFRNNWDRAQARPHTGLAGLLRDLDVTDVYVCGLARDYCVSWTAQDAASLGFQSHLLWDLSRPVSAESDDAVRLEMRRAGVAIVEGHGHPLDGRGSSG